MLALSQKLQQCKHGYLTELEADELIVRTECPQIPPKVEYALSESGKPLMRVLNQFTPAFRIATAYLL